jgi:hypothetical protein
MMDQSLPDNAVATLSLRVAQAKQLIATVPWREIADRLASIWRRIAEAIVRIWLPVKRHLLFLRAHGTHAQKRYAWKILHAPRRRSVKARQS